MPELPEVETVVRYVRPQLVGRTINQISTSPKNLHMAWQNYWNSEVVGKRIQAVDRRGKWILLALSDGKSHLVVHLGMTGRLVVVPRSEPVMKHTHLIFSLDRGKWHLRYQDPRRFGSVRWILQEDEHRFPQEKDLGPEPFELNGEYVYKAMISSKRCLKALLLDQSIVAGVGNIYADESLYRARLLPTRAGNTLTNEESNRLCRAIRTVIQRAIEKKGSTISNFYFGNGDTGSYQNEFDVYDRGQEPCKRCRTPLKNIRLAGRTTTYCALCQK